MITLSHGAIQAFFAVLAGAFGAHGLENILNDYSLRIWHTAAQYQITHALALLLLGVIEEQKKTKLSLVHWCFGLGILLFSGSLYALALSGIRPLGMITPLGGTAFLIGWLSLAWKCFRQR